MKDPDDRSAQPNVHLPYGFATKPFHRKVAALAAEHTQRDGAVLDIGCGLGNTLRLLHEYRPDLQLSAADIDPYLLGQLPEAVPADRRIILDDVADLFAMSERYDTIIMSHVLEHSYRPLDTVLGINTILADNGCAIYAVPNPHEPLNIARSVARKDYVNRGHVYAWDRAHWCNFLERIAGLDVVEHTQDFVPLRPGLNPTAGFAERMEIRLASVLPWLSRSHISVVRKTHLAAAGSRPGMAPR